MEQKNHRNPSFLLISAMVIYGSIGIFRRSIPLSSGALAFARGLIGGIFLLIWVKLTGGSLKLGISRKKLVMLFATGVVLGLNWVLLFEAYNHTTVAVATLCYYMQPTLLILLSPLVFRERLTAKKGICAGISVAGMVLVSGALDGTAVGREDMQGILYGLAAAVLYTVVIILNKKNPMENLYGKTVAQLLFSAVVLLPYLLLTDQPGGVSMNATAVIMLLVVCIVHTGIAYAMYFTGVQRLPSQTVAVLSYIDPVVAMLLSGIILKEPMSAGELVGGVMILGAAVVSEVSFSRKT